MTSSITKEYLRLATRRQFFKQAGLGFGGIALGSLLSKHPLASILPNGLPLGGRGALGAPHFAPKANRVIYLFMAGAPSQLDLLDYKPNLKDWFDKDLPAEVRGDQRLTGMTSGQDRFPIAPSIYDFHPAGQSGTYISELLPHTAKIVDDIAIVKSMWTEAINHDPGITYILTGKQQPGRPSLGAWLSYGLGSVNENLPSFVVLNSSWTGRRDAQALFSRLWGSGFLPSSNQGVMFQSKGKGI